MQKLFCDRRRRILTGAIPLVAVLGACATASRTTPVTRTVPHALPLRALIVGGGPSAENTQYAIESNTRYLAALTTAARSQTILFADGSKSTRSVNAVDTSDADTLATALAFLFDDPWPEARLKFHPPLLRRIDGAASKSQIDCALRDVGQRLKSDERALLYFTGHGFPGGDDGREDFENTHYALWNDADLSVRELAAMLRALPSQHPVVLVMVQCHAGGFANLMFENGDPKRPLLTRDFCGFFASTKDRMSAGCTPEVDERNYHDFTTHFFAALAGRTRDNRTISGADYDRDRRVSLLEAFAWANLHDESIDVPVCTSDVFLRHIFRADGAWRQMPYAKVLAAAAPWQRAMLDGLSRRLELKGEERVPTVWQQMIRAEPRDSDDDSTPWPEAILERRATLLETLEKRFPGLQARPGSLPLRAARDRAMVWLKSRPAELRWIQEAVEDHDGAQEAAELREAMQLRFLRVARTIWCQEQLRLKGTPAQKRFFQKLRLAENRNPLRD